MHFECPQCVTVIFPEKRNVFDGFFTGHTSQNTWLKQACKKNLPNTFFEQKNEKLIAQVGLPIECCPRVSRTEEVDEAERIKMLTERGRGRKLSSRFRALIVGVFSDQEMKKHGTEPATTSLRKSGMPSLAR